MQIKILTIAISLLTINYVNTETAADTCDISEIGPWSSLLEEWATAPHSDRQGRIMALPPTKNYYVTDRIDTGLVPPRPYNEWQNSLNGPPGPGKIVNRPTYPNKDKDKFKPSYPPPQPPQHPQAKPPRPQGSVDRVDEAPPQPPRKEVSETDLYLLGAIEKLVYRVDLMEKRLRKMEESMHYLVAGQHKAPATEPCVANFTRIGPTCYHFSPAPEDWKTANLACRRLRSNLIEFETDNERRQFISFVQSDNRLKDSDLWTGGLNPGLLWIWSNSARPILDNSTSAQGGNSSQNVYIAGEGRCLAVLYEPAIRAHVYRGQDCSFKHRYVCEKQEDKTKLSNEIERVAKMMRPLAELAAGRRTARSWGGEDAPADRETPVDHE